MTMQGNLQDYGFAQVLQHIAATGRDGVLQVTHRGSQTSFSFVAGGLVRTRTVGFDAERELRDQLVKAEAVSAQAESGLGGIDSKTIAVFETLRSSDAIFHAFLHTDGAYSWTEMPVPPASSHEPIAAAVLLSRGLEQLNRWPQIRRHIPSSSLVFAHVGSLDAVLAEQSAVGSPVLKSESAAYAAVFDVKAKDAVAWGQTDEARVGHAERLVYSLIDGSRDVQALVALSYLGEFSTLAALSVLADLSLIGRVAGGSPNPTAAAGVALTRGSNALRLAFGSVGKVVLFCAQVVVLVLMALSGQRWNPHAPCKAELAFDAQGAQSIMWEALAPAILQRHQQAQTGAAGPWQPLWQPWQEHALRWPDPQQVILVRPLR